MMLLEIADDIFTARVQGISLIRLQFPHYKSSDLADVQTVMKNTGSALMGIGVASEKIEQQ